MPKQNGIEIYKFHVFYITFVNIKLNSVFQYFSSYNTSCSFKTKTLNILFKFKVARTCLKINCVKLN